MGKTGAKTSVSLYPSWTASARKKTHKANFAVRLLHLLLPRGAAQGEKQCNEGKTQVISSG